MKNVMWRNWRNCGTWCPTLFKEGRTQVLNLKISGLPSVPKQRTDCRAMVDSCRSPNKGSEWTMDLDCSLRGFLFWGEIFCKWFEETSEIEKLHWSANAEVWISPPLRVKKFVDILQLSNVEPFRTTCWKVGEDSSFMDDNGHVFSDFSQTLLPPTTRPVVQTCANPWLHLPIC